MCIMICYLYEWTNYLSVLFFLLTIHTTRYWKNLLQFTGCQIFDTYVMLIQSFIFYFYLLMYV